MPTRSPLVFIAALSLACSSSAHEIGTLGPTEAGTSGAMGGSGAGSSGDSSGGQGGSGAGVSMSGVSAASGDLASGGQAASGAGVSMSGVSAGSSSGSADASTVASADASDDRMAAVSDALSGPFPARIVFFYTPLGTVLDSWRPVSPAQGQFSLSSILAPLQPLKDHLLIVDGIDDLAHPGVLATDQNGPTLVLTGQASGDSLGSRLSKLGGAQVAFQQVLLGVQCGVAIDYGNGGLPEPPSNNPGTMASQIFGLDRPQIAAQFSNTTDFAAAGHQQMDLVHLALQYDRTRVLSLSWGDVRGATLFNWVAGVDKDYRTLATNSGVAGPDRDHFIAVQTWFAQEFAYLVGSLAGTPEGNGSLLDHTLVVWISETGEASAHTGKNIPVVIAGNMNGRFRKGAYVQTSGSQANLLSTIASVAGVATFGDPALGNTPIAALLN